MLRYLESTTHVEALGFLVDKTVEQRFEEYMKQLIYMGGGNVRDAMWLYKHGDRRAIVPMFVEFVEYTKKMNPKVEGLS